MIKVKIHGANELSAALKKLPKQMGEAAVLSALRSGAAPIRREARRRAPVRTEPGPKRLTKGSRIGRLPGFLRRSIVLRRVREAGKKFLIKVGPTAAAFHGLFIEFGTKAGVRGQRVNSDTGGRRSRKVLRSHPGTPAKPFLAPAFEAAKSEALKRIFEQLGRAVERAAAKLATRGQRPRRR